MTDSEFQKIIDQITQNQTEEIKLSGLPQTGLNQDQIQILADTLKTNLSIKKLILSINFDDTGFQKIAEMLQVNQSITDLYIHTPSIGSVGIAAIAETLKINITLQTLVISLVNIEPCNVERLTEVLKTNKTLKTFVLADCGINNESAEKIADALKFNKTLKVLGLCANQIGPDGAEKIANALKINTSLQYLSIGSNPISNAGAMHIINALLVNPFLIMLDLTNTQINNDEVVDHLASILPQTGLLSLTLSANQITIERLAGALKDNETLVQFSIAECNINDIGAEKIANALKTNQTLKLLDVSSNQIGPTGAEKIADALKINTSLNCLSLKGNDILNTGAKKIIDALSVNPSLTKLNISDTQIDDHAFAQLVDVINQTGLTSLNCSSNPITDVSTRKISKLLRTNTTLHAVKLDFIEFRDLEKKRIDDQLNINKQIKYILKQNHFANISLTNQVRKLLQQKQDVYINSLTCSEAEKTKIKMNTHFRRRRFRIEVPFFLQEIAAKNLNSQLDDKLLSIMEAAKDLPGNLFGPIINEYFKEKNENAFSEKYIKKSRPPRLKLFNPYYEKNTAKEFRQNRVWKIGPSR